MTYFNAVKFISAAPDTSHNASTRMLAILERLGNPQRRIKYVRLAGSNGKTVCAEMMISILGKASYTVGCLRMPMRVEPRENICIGSECLSMDEFSEYIKEVRAAIYANQNDTSDPFVPTKSEILLAVALLAFRRHKCDLCIIESDHFGSDPSKLLPPPFAAIICGTIPSNDNSEISRIRSYIIKGIQEIVSVPQNSEAYRIISDTCYSVNCRLTLPTRSAISVKRLTLGGTEFSYKGRSYCLKLCGQFQISNAVLVLETVEMLIRRGFNISSEAIYDGLATLKIPAKFEIISLRPLMIVDSTHTPVAIEIVCDALADFKEQAPKKIRLCLPSAELAKHYTEALTARGYEIEQIVLPEGEQDIFEEQTVFCKTKKAIAKMAYQDLSRDLALLISGDYPFVIPIRYELLTMMGFE